MHLIVRDCQRYLAGWGVVQLQENFLISKKRLMFRNPATHLYYTVYSVKTSSAEVCDIPWSVCTIVHVCRYKTQSSISSHEQIIIMSLLIKQPHREVTGEHAGKDANRGRGFTEWALYKPVVKWFGVQGAGVGGVRRWNHRGRFKGGMSEDDKHLGRLASLQHSATLQVAASVGVRSRSDTVIL